MEIVPLRHCFGGGAIFFTFNVGVGCFLVCQYFIAIRVDGGHFSTTFGRGIVELVVFARILWTGECT